MTPVLYMAGWKFYFSGDDRQPVHIYAEKGDAECKFWIDDEQFEIRPALEHNLTPQTRRAVKKIIYEHFDYIVSQYAALKKST